MKEHAEQPDLHAQNAGDSDSATTHIGGSARGYQELFTPLAIPAKAEQTRGQAVYLCIGALVANVLICRRQGGAAGPCFLGDIALAR